MGKGKQFYLMESKGYLMCVPSKDLRTADPATVTVGDDHVLFQFGSSTLDGEVHAIAKTEKAINELMDELKNSRKKAKKESSFSLDVPRRAKRKALATDFKSVHSGASAKVDSAKEKAKEKRDEAKRKTILKDKAAEVLQKELAAQKQTEDSSKASTSGGRSRTNSASSSSSNSSSHSSGSSVIPVRSSSVKNKAGDVQILKAIASDSDSSSSKDKVSSCNIEDAGNYVEEEAGAGHSGSSQVNITDKNADDIGLKTSKEDSMDEVQSGDKGPGKAKDMVEGGPEESLMLEQAEKPASDGERDDSNTSQAAKVEALKTKDGEAEGNSQPCEESKREILEVPNKNKKKDKHKKKRKSKKSKKSKKHRRNKKAKESPDLMEAELGSAEDIPSKDVKQGSFVKINSSEDDGSSTSSSSEDESSSSTSSSSSSSSEESSKKRRRNKKKSKKKKESKRKRRAVSLDSSSSSISDSESRRPLVKRNNTVYEGQNYLYHKESPGAVQLHPKFAVYVLSDDLQKAKDESKTQMAFIRTMVDKIFTNEALANSTAQGFPPRSKGSKKLKNMKILPAIHPDGRSALLALTKELEDTDCKKWRPRRDMGSLSNAFSQRLNDFK